MSIWREPSGGEHRPRPGLERVGLKGHGLEVLASATGREAAISAITTSTAIAVLLGVALTVTMWLDTLLPLGYGYPRVLLLFWWVSSLGAATLVASTTGWGKINVTLLCLPAAAWLPSALVAGDLTSWLPVLVISSPFWCWAGIMVNAVVRLRETHSSGPVLTAVQ